MRIFLLDVDNTIAPFQPTAELYKSIFLRKRSLKYLAFGYFMIIMLKLFWFSSFVVEFQRKLIMSLLSKADLSQLELESSRIAARVAESYNSGFKKVLSYYKQKNDKIYLLTHCPDLIARKIVEMLGFDGEYSIEIKDYFKTRSDPVNIDKYKIIQKFKTDNPGAKTYYFADDLIDIKCLLIADEGVLVNGSFFTKLICQLLFRKVKIWG